MNRDKVKLLFSYFYIFCFMLAQVWLISKFKISQDFVFIFTLFTLSHIGLAIRFNENNKEASADFWKMSELAEEADEISKELLEQNKLLLKQFKQASQWKWN